MRLSLIPKNASFMTNMAKMASVKVAAVELISVIF
jgi:hypothetical protein